jgi:VanZ family protein
MFYRNKWWIAVLIWCVVIFLFSELSIFRGDHTAKVIKEAVGEVRVHAISLNVIVRTLAHIFLFGVLSALVWKAMQPRRWDYIGAFLFTILYALTDEWHQSFQPGRTASIRDVGIDSIGALFSLICIWLMTKQKALYGEKRTTQQKSDNSRKY